MISSLKILNFLSHARTELTFHKGVNVIVGATDSGKSAIIRALRWAIWNRPSGDSIRSWWGGETSSEVVVNGNVITRYKDKVDKYQIQAEGKDVQEFKAIGTSVPEEVSRLLNINEINLQYQFDSHFLLSQSPGQVAEFFNKVAHLEMIDRGTSNVNSAIRSLEQDIKYKTAEIERQEEQLKTYEYLVKMEAEVEVLEEMDKQLTITHQSWQKLNKIKGELIEIGRDIEAWSDILALEIQVDKLIWQDGQRQDIQWNRDQLDILLEHIREDTIDLKNLKWVMSFETPVNNLLELYGKRKIANETFLGLLKLTEYYNKINNTLEKTLINISSLEKKFKQEMPNICPLCNQEIK